MKNSFKIRHSKTLYIFFIFLSLNIFFFSTVKTKAKSFEINDIDITRPFEINFDKNEVIDEGFRKAYNQLLSLILSSVILSSNCLCFFSLMAFSIIILLSQKIIVFYMFFEYSFYN